MNPVKPYILGAGMSGCIAGIMNPSATILEAKPMEAFMSSPEHKAVLRFRTNNISQLTGIPFRQVEVRKSIWFQGKEYRVPDIRLTNMYSRKVAGGYFDRSIVNLDTVSRWLPPEDFHVQLLSKLRGRVKFGYGITGINKDRILVRRDGAREDEESPLDRSDRPVISTIALPIMAKILGVPSPVSFSSGKKVYVIRIRVSNCNLNVSMYYPDPELPVYRASVMGDVLSIEMIQDMLPNGFGTKIPVEMLDCMSTVFSSLGIDSLDTKIIDHGSQLGKINYSVDERLRKNWILKLTLEHWIYSLGRFALWKNLLQDDVYQDSLKIRQFIESGTHYDFIREAVHA